MQDRLKDPSGKRPVRETEPDEVDLAITVRYERETLPSGEEVVHLNDGIHVLLEVGGFELGLRRRSRNESVATTPRARRWRDAITRGDSCVRQAYQQHESSSGRGRVIR